MRRLGLGSRVPACAQAQSSPGGGAGGGRGRGCGGARGDGARGDRGGGSRGGALRRARFVSAFGEELGEVGGAENGRPVPHPDFRAT